jgi:hypothetical protein
MEWVLLIWLNTEHAVVDNFRNISECEAKMRTYIKALKQADSKMTVSCELREKAPAKKDAKNP